MAIKVLIADDDALIREGLKIIIDIDEDFQVVGTVENGRQAVEVCLREQIDVVLLDIRMPILNGVQATKEITLHTKAKPLILTTFDDDEYIMGAVKNGAQGYLLKSTPPEKIKDAIKLVHSGSTVMQDIVLDKLKVGLNNPPPNDFANNGVFTERELTIMELIAKGLSNREISEQVYISEGTVKNYVTSILNKTGLQHRTQIAIYYLQGGNYDFSHIKR